MAGRPRLEIGTYGNITARPRGERWIAETRYRDEDGETRPVTAMGDTEAKAKAALRSRLKKRQKSLTDELSADSTVSTLLDQWLDSLEELRRPEDATERVKGLLDGDTIDKYREAADKFIRPRIGEVTLRELTTQRADVFLSNVPARKRHVRTVLRQACSLATRWGAMQYNPVREIKPLPRTPSDKRVLSPDDIRELMSRTVEWQIRKPGQGGPARGVDMDVFVALLLATGERTGEVLAIQWWDIRHLDDRSRPAELAITGTVTRHGKRKPMPKSMHGFRIVMLPEWARDALLRQRERGIPFDLVFPTYKGTPRRPGNMNRSWREIRGEDYAWVIPRTFRKTHGTEIEREHGADAAAKQLGHSSPDVTRAHYINRAHEAGDYTETLEKLDPFRPNTNRLGGGASSGDEPRNTA